MEIQMDEFLECQRIIEEQRRLLISNQDLRLKQVMVREAKRHTAHMEEQLVRDLQPLKMRIKTLEHICQNFERKQQTLNELHSVVCGVDFRSSILLLKCEASENQNRNKDVIIEKRKSMINRANATLQRDPKVCQVNAVCQSIENSKARLKAIGDLIVKENAQKIKDDQKDQNDIQREEKIIRDLNEKIRQAKQELQQPEIGYHSKNESKSEDSPQKPALKTASNNRPETPAKAQIEEEDFEISPVKIVEVDFLSQKKRIVPTAVQNNPAPANSSGSNYRAPSAANMVVNSSNVVHKNREQGSGSGNSHRSSGTSHMMANIPHNAKQPPTDIQHSRVQNLSAAMIEPKNRTPKPSIVGKKEEDLSILPIKFVESDYSVRQNQQNDHTKSHGQSNVQNSRGQGSSYRTPDASTTMVMNDPSFVRNNRGHGSGSDNNRRVSGAGLTMMTNVQYNATHPGHSNQFSGVQNLSTATNDTRLCSETPKPTMAGGNEEDEWPISPIKINETDYSDRKSVRNVTKPPQAKQNVSAAGQNNVTNNRGHGSGSGMSYRAPHDMVNDPSVAQNNRGHGIGSGIGYRAPDTSNKMVNDQRSAKSGMRYGTEPARFENEQHHMATSSNDMSTNSSLQQNLNVVNHMPYAALPKSTAPTASSAAPNKMTTAPNSGCPFVPPNLPPPYAQKRKGASDQADMTKKSRTGNQFDDNSSHREWSKKGVPTNPGQRSNDSSFINFDEFEGSFGDSFTTKFDPSNDEKSKKNGQHEKGGNNDFSFISYDEFAFGADENSGNRENNAVQDEDFDDVPGFE